MDDAELAEVYARHRVWSRSGRFEDPVYCRNTLPYMFVAKAHPETWFLEKAASEEEWTSIYAPANEQAQAFGPEEIPRECRRRVYAAQVAGLIGRRHTMERKLAPGDLDAAKPIYARALEEAMAMDDEALSEAFLVTESWNEEGKWKDPAWLRLSLAFLRASRAWLDQEGGIVPISKPIPGEAWDACIEAATTEVGRIPEAELAERVRTETDEYLRAVSRRGAQLMWLLLVGAALAMAVFSIGILDLLFVGLAVVTAYKVARMACEAPGRPGSDASALDTGSLGPPPPPE